MSNKGFKYRAFEWAAEVASVKLAGLDAAVRRVEAAKNNPVAELSKLGPGWDGYWASPLSYECIGRGVKLWYKFVELKIELPQYGPSACGAINFSWTSQYPDKELDIDIYDQDDYYCEYMLVDGEVVLEGIATSQEDVLHVVELFFM